MRTVVFILSLAFSIVCFYGDFYMGAFYNNLWWSGPTEILIGLSAVALLMIAVYVVADDTVMRR